MSAASYLAKLRSVLGHELLGLYTSPRFDVVYPNGDMLQNFVAAFHIAQWSGEIRANEESLQLGFFNPTRTPVVVEWHKEVLEDFVRWDGQTIVK